MAGKITNKAKKRKALRTALFVCIIVTVSATAFVYFFPPARHAVQNAIRTTEHKPGTVVDSLDGVYVYYNGRVGETHGRNMAGDGYNIGLKYQCVEFVKRYYYEHYRHKMPDSYGHAKDFFDSGVKDGGLNKRRGLVQYTNPSDSKPRKGDLLVYSETTGNPYGHVAIISAVSDDEITVIQQNPGRRGRSRVSFGLEQDDGKWKIANSRIMGWLRMREKK